jgi:hypothetical protein
VGAPFRNLGFDEAITDNVTFNPQFPGTGVGPISDLLPGWDLLYGTTPLSSIGINLFTGEPNYASLFDRNNDYQAIPVEGRYALGLTPGPGFNNGAIIQYTLTQTGDVPPGTKFIQFLDINNVLELRVNGGLVPLYLSSIPGIPNPVSFGDISAYAGQEVKLEFTTVLSFMNGIDGISFLIPEASSWTLLSFGSIVLVLSRKVFRR